jgi:hypothetical protein
MASKRNEFSGISPGGKGGQNIGLTTLPTAGGDFRGILGFSNSWNPKGLTRSVMG